MQYFLEINLSTSLKAGQVITIFLTFFFQVPSSIPNPASSTHQHPQLPPCTPDQPVRIRPTSADRPFGEPSPRARASDLSVRPSQRVRPQMRDSDPRARSRPKASASSQSLVRKSRHPSGSGFHHDPHRARETPLFSGRNTQQQAHSRDNMMNMIEPGDH